MLLVFISLFFLNINLFSVFYFYLILVILFLLNSFITKSQWYVNYNLNDVYLSYFFNKFFIKSLNNFLLNLWNYRYFNLLFNSFFKWSPLFKKTSYFGLYNFSKNK
jgi:hypothetical protein